MNEVFEVFGDNDQDCAGLAHAIMSSMNEKTQQNANDGVRTRFLIDRPFFLNNPPGPYHDAYGRCY